MQSFFFCTFSPEKRIETAVEQKACKQRPKDSKKCGRPLLFSGEKREEPLEKEGGARENGGVDKRRVFCDNRGE